MDYELASPGVLCSLSTEELLTKIQEWGLDVTEAEAQHFRDNEVDGDTVDCGLTETMVAYLFQGSFKKQVKFNQFVSRMKESSVTLTLQTVSPEDWQPSTSSTSIRYPTNSEYVQAVKTLVMKYPFLKDREGNGYLCNELGWIQPTTGNVSQRFREGLSCVAAKVIDLTQGKTPLYQLYLDAREEALTDDLPDLDTRAALLFLPYVFKEKLDLFVILGEVHPKTPYPTVQLLHEDWKPVFSRSAPNIVKLDGSEVCRSSCIFEGIISSFCLYFVFNLAYPKHLKNTLIFLQKYIVKIDEGEDRPLPITVTRQINLLY
ncbi:uncharacterized protein LOC143412483 [Maylandia zebra]|uniref:uncharacterized protein LOC143412483 n=1 Tax=Maylandia zebra TaxID=106582 RepID=UPI00403C6704